MSHAPENLAYFAAAPVDAHYTRGFNTAESGFMPTCGAYDILLRSADKHGLFPTRREAIQAAEAFRDECRKGMETSHG